MDLEELIDEGIQARQQINGGQWRLGDLALQVETVYGKHTLENYAERIGEEHHRLEQYRWVAGRYEKSVRTENLSWSHYERIAARNDRFHWLKAAAEHAWGVHQMVSEISRAREEEERQLKEETRRREKEEILPKVLVLAESTPSYQVFQERLPEVIPAEGVHFTTQASITKWVKRYYADDLKRQQQEGLEQQAKDNELRGNVRALDETREAIIHLAGLQRDAPPFRMLAAALQSQSKKGPLSYRDPHWNPYKDFYVPDAAGFSLEDAKKARAYLDDVIDEMESAEGR